MSFGEMLQSPENIATKHTRRSWTEKFPMIRRANKTKTFTVISSHCHSCDVLHSSAVSQLVIAAFAREIHNIKQVC